MASGLKILRLLRLLKLFRLYRIRRMIKVLHQKFPKSTFVVTSLELLLTMVLFAHWTSCLWFVVGYPNGWVTLQNIVTNGERVPNQRFYEWISSFYW